MGRDVVRTVWLADIQELEVISVVNSRRRRRLLDSAGDNSKVTESKEYLELL